MLHFSFSNIILIFVPRRYLSWCPFLHFPHIPLASEIPICDFRPRKTPNLESASKPGIIPPCFDVSIVFIIIYSVLYLQIPWRHLHKIFLKKSLFKILISFKMYHQSLFTEANNKQKYKFNVIGHISLCQRHFTSNWSISWDMTSCCMIN